MYAFITAIAALLAPAGIATAGSDTLPDGAYEIVSRLELPHVERWAIEQTARVCLPGDAGGSKIPIPIFSANNPFGECAVANVHASGTSIAYDITCPGRASAKAHARYSFDGDGFRGRIDMVMAAKNMTMTEVVRARRLGRCEARSASEALAATR
jgi:hypothetical protein